MVRRVREWGIRASGEGADAEGVRNQETESRRVVGGGKWKPEIQKPKSKNENPGCLRGLL
jgi:hypothetical protein